jgi:long-chain acyl-CoA synthetase
VTGPVPVAVDPSPAIARGVTLLRSLGLGAGDRAAVLLGNDVASFGVLAAACLEGVVAVPLPPDLAAGELRAIAADADPRVVIADPTVVPRRPEVDDLAVLHQVTVDDLARAPATDPAGPWPRTRPMAYTSGTTGRRKGVHVGVHGQDWGREVVDDEHRAFDRRHGDHHLVVSPLYHSGPFRFALVTALLGGRIAVLPTFSARAWRTALLAVRPTSLFCVPTHLHRLVADAGQHAAEALRSLTLLAHAGAPCPEPLKRRVLDLAPDGATWEFYGSTEGQFTACPPEVWAAAPGSVGRARAGRRLEVRREDGTEATTGEVGTVWCHVPDHARFQYWRDADRTAAAWDGDAFTVGDLGALDDEGLLSLAGRPGDLVISGGVNVYPAEVERHLLDLSGVAEAAVFGVPDDEWGERVVAAVVAWPGVDLDAAALGALLARSLRRAEVPKTITVVDDLPRTATGKVRRVGLADALLGPDGGA